MLFHCSLQLLFRQLIENQGFYFLDKDKRGDFKIIENLQYVAAMGHPTGGRNDIPDRLKSKFFICNMVLPSTVSVDLCTQPNAGSNPCKPAAYHMTWLANTHAPFPSTHPMVLRTCSLFFAATRLPLLFHGQGVIGRLSAVMICHSCGPQNSLFQGFRVTSC